MHPNIACTQRPNDAYNYASKTVVHTSMATRGQPFPCSLWSILWPLNRLSWPLPREKSNAKSCARLRTSCTTNRELQKRQQVGYRLVVELVHILRMFHITTESYQAVFAVHIPARCMRVCTYPIFSYSSAKSNLKVSIKFKTSKTSFTTVRIISMLIISIPMSRKFSKLLLFGTTIRN